MIKEEEQEEMVEVSDSEDNFEIVNQPSTLEALTGDLINLPSVQVRKTKKTPLS